MKPHSLIRLDSIVILAFGCVIAVVELALMLLGILGGSAVVFGVIVTLGVAAIGSWWNHHDKDQQAQRAQEHQERQRAAEVRAALVQIDEPVAESAVDILTNPTHLNHFWPNQGIGEPNDPSTWPTIAPADGDPGFGPHPEGSWVRLAMPTKHLNPEAYVNKLSALAQYIGANEVRIHSAEYGTLTLILVTRDPVDHNLLYWRDHFHTELYDVVTTLAQTRQARAVWSELGIANEPKPSHFFAGEWPTLLPGEHDGEPDIGIWPTPVGARMRLQIPAGKAPKDFEKKLPNLAATLDIPEVRITGGTGKEIELELRVNDPIAEITMSPLIVEHTEPGPYGDTITTYRPAVRPNSLTCYDDILLGYTEHGDPVVINLADSTHYAFQGASRSGKSVALNTVIAHAMLMSNVKVTIIDSNGAATPPWYQCAHRLCDTNDADQVVEILEELLAELQDRKGLFFTLQQAKITEFSPTLPMHLIVFDEVANFRKDKRIAALLEDIASQALKYGGVLIFAGQKLDENNIPIAARSNTLGRISYRVMAQPDFYHLFPGQLELAHEASSTRNPLEPGIGYAALPRCRGPVRFRSIFLPDQACYPLGELVIAARGAKRPKPDSAEKNTTPSIQAEQFESLDAEVVDLDKYRQDQDDPGAEPQVCGFEDCSNIVTRPKTGRPPKYCSKKCQQAAYRRRSALVDHE